jgi:hypothetical protein
MTNLRELQKQLLFEVGTRLKAHGFDEKVRAQSYWMKIPHGRVAFHLSFIEHKSDFDVTADIGIRFDEVEELVNENKVSLSKKLRADTYTLGAELGNIIEGRQRRWTVYQEDDIPVVAASIVLAFEMAGNGYIEKWASPEAALEILSRDDKDSWLHSPFHAARAERAVALAFVLNRFTELPEIVTRKEKFLRDRNDFGLSSFLDTATTLLNRSKAVTKQS